MKLGITGLPQAGKTTVFEALTRQFSDGFHKNEHQMATIHVPDFRVDELSRMFSPKKTTYAQVEYFLPAHTETKEKKSESGALTPLRDADALIHVVRNFSVFGADAPTPFQDFHNLDQEFILTDLVSAEKRLERLAQDRQRGRGNFEEEISLVNECKTLLDKEIPLRKNPEIATHPLLRGFAFLSAKPQLVLFNNQDEDTQIPGAHGNDTKETQMVIRGKLEQEIAQMSEEEAEAFLEEFDIQNTALSRVIQKSYEILGMQSFFTVGEDEVRAWTISSGTAALDAAGVIHSDMKKGFIRAEVISYHDLMEAGSLSEARKKGTLRLEGKTYVVDDGDIVHFRFNV